MAWMIHQALCLSPGGVHQIGAEIESPFWLEIDFSGTPAASSGEIKEFANVQIEVVLQPAAAQALLERLERDLFPRYGMIAFEADVRVIRSGKF